MSLAYSYVPFKWGSSGHRQKKSEKFKAAEMLFCWPWRGKLLYCEEGHMAGNSNGIWVEVLSPTTKRNLEEESLSCYHSPSQRLDFSLMSPGAENPVMLHRDFWPTDTVRKQMGVILTCYVCGNLSCSNRKLIQGPFPGSQSWDPQVSILPSAWSPPLKHIWMPASFGRHKGLLSSHLCCTLFCSSIWISSL